MRALVLCADARESSDIAAMLGGSMPVDAAFSAEEALVLARRRRYGLYIIDVSVAGAEPCRVIRRFSSAAVIFVAPGHDSGKAVEGFEAGADDYVSKPYGMLELSGHVRAVLRRCEGQKRRRVEWIDEETRTAMVDGERVALSPTEFEILMTLASANGAAVSKREIVRGAWGGGDFATDDALKVRMKALRDKIGAERIETVRGYGYRMPRES